MLVCLQLLDETVKRSARIDTACEAILYNSERECLGLRMAELSAMLCCIPAAAKLLGYTMFCTHSEAS